MHNDAAWRGVWVAITLVIAVLVGVAGGVLSWAGGMNVENAILAGAGAFAASVLLMIVLVQFATGGGG